MKIKLFTIVICFLSISAYAQVDVKTSKNSKIKINIRKAPSTDAAIIAQAYHGVIFTVVEEQEDWLKVVYRTGLQGWVNKRFVWGY